MNANERPRLLQGIAVVDEGAWAIDGPVTGTIDAGIDTARSDRGRLVPNKPPGTTAVTAVAWAMAGEQGDSLRAYTQRARLLGAVLPTLLICLVAWRRYTPRHGLRVTTAAVVAYVLATPVSSYARVLFGHQLAACSLFVGTVWLLQSRHVSNLRKDLGFAFAGGFACAAAVVVDYLAVFAAVPLGVFVVRVLAADRLRGVPWAAAALGGATLPMVGLAAYQAQVFGNPWSTGYHYATHVPFAAIHARGLLGLVGPTTGALHEHLVSPWGGLLPWAPLIVVGALGLCGRIRESNDPEPRLGLGMLAVFLVVNLCLQQTGGWRVGPRYFVLAFPFVILGLSWVFSRVSTRPLVLGALFALLTWSVVVNTLAAALFPHLIPHGNPLSDLLGPLLAEGAVAHGWVSRLAGPSPVSTPILVLCSVFMAVLALLGVARGRAGRLAATGGVVVGFLVAGMALAAPEEPAAASDRALISQIWEPRAGSSQWPSRWIPR